ncbi:receptor-interacting serine/threonine-protein kinase 1 [Danio rerio]|uniref:Receptor-interacting protein 1 n=1 Tax=Danio rerio TaxID=7955 RepID=Q0MSH9_DANRE|nr:receptor-interacting serine/threonine-protein kinase 1 [Danio rerio]ABH10823.1 receptor-interacting protein 1 [Danio rerio]|eukprot:NP_001036815.1 receptor-interacting serine/threonine-protein kinase 1 [Danio rerio]
MSTSVSPSLMKSADLIKKEPLDYGGFGEVYLCYHKTLGHVVLKTVYTGPPRSGRQKQSLLEEGSLMSRLNHQRVVKLLGVILEDGDYSLVMELIPKGNLLTMLEKVTVPISVKGRIILEILEGMVYLTKNQVIHKDLKPENILVDKNFHIKIADLGLATSEVWSKLTKEESRRQSRLGKKTSAHAAGTLCYMAPEHLKSIHTRSSEKSDVYSFAIVLWVILTGREPYEDARSEDQICHCVCQGERPDEALIPPNTPTDITDLMKSCWHQDPLQRPSFTDCYNRFLPFYKEKLAANVKADLENLMKLYEGPEELVEKLKLLNTNALIPEDPSLCSRDSPTPLRSSDIGPVEASIEDLSFRSCEDSVLEADATPSCPNLELKLEQEYNYHKFGSRIVDQSDGSMWSPAQQPASSTDASSQMSSVKSWTKPSAPSTEEELYPRAAASFDSLHRPELRSQFSVPQSDHERLRPHAHLPWNRVKSCPEGANHVAESLIDTNSNLRFNSPVTYPASDSAFPVSISNASAIQIGSYNTMNLRISDSSPYSSLSTTGSTTSRYKELLLMYESHTVTESHLELVRQNVGANWKQVARKLGLSEIDVETIEHDYDRDGLTEKVHQMLERWKMREGLMGITVGKLCQALEGCIKPNALLHMLRQLQDSAAAP